MTTTQEIKKEIVLKASRQAVWDALTTVDGWSGWFSQGVEGSFQPGTKLNMDFGKWGNGVGIVVDRNEMRSISFKWHPGGDNAGAPESEMTTAEFLLEDHPEGTKLTLREFGFENVPADKREGALEGNKEGWDWELAELQAFVEQGERQVLGRDEIVREKIYPLSKEKLWDLVATPEGLKKWFVEDVQGDFKPGSIATLVFYKDVSGPIKVIESNRPNSFMFRWHPGEKDGCTWDKYPEEETTQTTFTLTDAEGGTLLRIVESGFDKLPKERRVNAAILNNQGWSQVLDLISKGVEAS